MRRIVFLILAVFFLVFFLPPVQAAGVDYTALKNDYIQDHPGQAIIPFPWEPMTSTQVLPFNYIIPAAPGNTVSITACRDEFESASFILNAQKDLSGIAISVPNLYDSKGNSIPASAINVRTVKVWYQAGYNDPNMWFSTPKKYLAPELLLKDDSLVKVDYGTQTNYLKVTINGVAKYVDISSPTATLPSNAQIHDAQTLQPFTLKATENKQIWVTVHIPKNTPAGNYYGNFVITASSQSPVSINFCVKVLPFELEPAPLEYGLMYFGQLPTTTEESQKVGIEGDWKSPEKYLAELQDMKDHGVLYPTINEWYLDDASSGTLKLALSLRNQVGLPHDRIYVVGLQTGNPTDSAGLTKLKNDVTGWKRIAALYGYQDMYIFGIDEAKGDVLRSERTAWKAVHAAGGKVFVGLGTGNTGAVNIVGDLLDVAVVAGPLNTTQAAQWHSYGEKIFSYANPQVGVEDPQIYRKNYGFALWNAGYDGSMNFQYQHNYGPGIWNDFDSASKHFRDHVFAYPTTHGVIDTIEWEGWREGVDDTRYLASLKAHDGSYTSGRAIVAAGLSRGDDMGTIRKSLINRILGSVSSTTTSLSITSPNGGESWLKGSSHAITWTSTGNVGSYLKMEVLKAGVVVQTLSSSTPNDGSFSWTISSSLATGSDYRIRITSTTNSAITDTRPGTFTINPSMSSVPSAAITVTSPNGGETWKRGTTHTVTWDYTGSPGSYVKITRLQGGVEVGTISTSTAIGSGGHGSFVWNIGATGTTGSNCQVKIQSISQPAIYDVSNSYFILNP